MQEISLKESLFPAQSSSPVWEISIGEKLREMTALNPAAPALVEVTVEGVTERRWTYGELLADAEQLAEALSTRFAPGERVVVWAHNIPEWVLMEYACALSGLVLVTANPAFQPKELRYVLEQSGAVALFLVESYRGNPMAEIGREATEGIAAIREVTLLTDRDAMLARGERTGGLPDVQPGDAAQIQYTSGTTGFPKGAVLSHRGLLNNARFYMDRSGTTADNVWLNPMPLFHTSGCGMSVLGAMQVGASIVLVSLFDPAVVNRLVEEERISGFVAVPTMILGMVEAFAQEPRDFSSVRVISSGGSMVPPELVRSATNTFGCDFAILYGQTEYSPVVTQQHLGDAFDDICTTIGQPIDHTDVSIRSVEGNAVVPLGEVGEICARGPCTMLEYHANPEATAETIDEQGWLHTGDLGTMDARGFVKITGRVKEMIIRGGENHFPAEIENTLLEHPNVAEIAVIGLPDEKWGEIIAAFYRSESNVDVDEGSLRAHCRAHLAPQKTPVVWQRVTSFPLTGSGKIQKFALRDLYTSGHYGPA